MQTIENIKRLQPSLNYGYNLFALSHKDSNLIKQNQNLLCYHYTMGQSYMQITNYELQITYHKRNYLNADAKVMLFYDITKFSAT